MSTHTSELGERLAIKWCKYDYDDQEDHVDRETANWWLDAIADEIEDKLLSGYMGDIDDWLRGGRDD